MRHVYRSMRVVGLWLATAVLGAAWAGAAEYCALYQNLPASASWRAGTTVTVPVRVVNCGTLTWPANGPFRLSYVWFKDEQKLPGEGLRTQLPTSVGPNGSVNLNASVKVPNEPGAYSLRFDMVHEGVAWFSAKGVLRGRVPVTVTSRMAMTASPRNVQALPAGPATNIPPLPIGRIVVTKPAGGERWVAGTQEGIEWTRIGEMGNKVDIELINADTGQSVRTINHQAANDGRYVWLIPSPQQQGRYKVRVTALEGDASGESAAFTMGNRLVAQAVSQPLPAYHRIDVTAPTGGTYQLGYVAINVVWETGIPEVITIENGTQVPVEYEVDLYKEDRVTKVPGSGLHLSDYFFEYDSPAPGKYSAYISLTPEMPIATGRYTVKVTPRRSLGHVGGAPGFSPTFEIRRQIETQLVTIEAAYDNKRRHHITWDLDGHDPNRNIQPNCNEMNGLGLVGHGIFSRDWSGDGGLSSGYEVHQFLYRTRLDFNLAGAVPPGKTLKKAWVWIQNQDSTGSGGFLNFPNELWALTGPWPAVLEVSGYQLAPIPVLASATVDVTALARDWLSGAKPNYGVLIIPNFPPGWMEPPKGTWFGCCAYPKAWLNLEFEGEK